MSLSLPPSFLAVSALYLEQEVKLGHFLWEFLRTVFGQKWVASYRVVDAAAPSLSVVSLL